MLSRSVPITAGALACWFLASCLASPPLLAYADVTLDQLIARSERPINIPPFQMPVAVFVETRDKNRRPVAGAYITLRVLGKGAGGTFDNNLTEIQLVSDETGRAVAHFRPNNVEGNSTIQVVAVKEGITRTQTVRWNNSFPNIQMTQGLPKWALWPLIVGTATTLVTLGATRNIETPGITAGPSTVGPVR